MPTVDPEPLDPELIRLVRTLAVVKGMDPDAMLKAAFGRGPSYRLPVQSRSSQRVLRFMLEESGGYAAQVRCSVALGLSVSAVNQVWTRFRLRCGLLPAPPRHGKSSFRARAR